MVSKGKYISSATTFQVLNDVHPKARMNWAANGLSMSNFSFVFSLSFRALALYGLLVFSIYP